MRFGQVKPEPHLSIGQVELKIFFLPWGGRTAKKLLHFDLTFVAKLKPEILILEIGLNNLTCNKLQPEVHVVGSQLKS